MLISAAVYATRPGGHREDVGGRPSETGRESIPPLGHWIRTKTEKTAAVYLASPPQAHDTFYFDLGPSFCGLETGTDG